MKNLAPIYKALEDADQRGELIPFLLSLDGHFRRLECGPVLGDLHNAGKISLVSDENFAAIEALGHNDFWSVFHSLVQAIPELDCSYQDVLSLVKKLVDKAGSDGAAGAPNLSLVKWCKVNPEKAKQIVSEAKALEKNCLSHCVFAIQGLADTELAFDLLDHPDKRVVAVGLRSLGRLEIDRGTIAKRVIDECCKAIAGGKDQDVRSSAIETAFKAWEKIDSSEPYRQKEFLEAIISEKEGDELVQLSAFLFHNQKGLVSESVEQILDAFSGEVSNPQAVLHWLNHAIHSKDEKWSLTKVIDAFAAQILKLDNSIEASQFYNFCQWIWEDPDNASQLFSRWLVSGQFSLCKFLVEMVGEAGKNNALVEISKRDLPNDSNDQIFLARKCVGFLWFNEVTAASILLSIVKNGKKTAREAAEELLFEPLLLSYGGDLRSFIERQSQSPSKRISDCVQRLIKNHDTYIAGLKRTEHVVEFLPTIEQRRAAGMKDRERNKDIQKQAHERSIFAQLVTHQTLLYGNKSFSMIYGAGEEKKSSVTPLSEISYSTEYPRLAVVDPVGFGQMLAIFRVE
ncbi:hypothetical protein [Halomonas sp. LBP4]|uniref:hypothetical protein n=1 Tax=Halomonas sp. LBP4 TaxID=2044917 RepID=UPI000D759B04|nr:hypothetical protein [Halomonas sp. LBP4]PXX99293.1 hypothetical protein CR157_00415 [Halomonas sp. LBP4]